MTRVWMLLVPWLMSHADQLIAWLLQRYAVKRCGGMQGRNIICDTLEEDGRL